MYETFDNWCNAPELSDQELAQALDDYFYGYQYQQQAAGSDFIAAYACSHYIS